MKPPLNLIAVEAIAVTPRHAFIEHADGTGSQGLIPASEYPPSELGERMRKMRLARDLDIRVTAALLGLSASEYSRLELGHLTLSADDWRRALNEIGPLPL